MSGNEANAATTYTWETTTSGSLWSTSGDWNPIGPADGAGNTADFSALDIAATTTVNLDSNRTIGSLLFGDTSGSSGWILGTTGGTLTLDNTGGSGAPLINVKTAGETVQITAPLAGTHGATITGASAAFLQLDAANTGLSGQVTLNSTSGTGGQFTLELQTNNALGSATLFSDPGGSNNARIMLDSGVNIANNITINTQRTLSGGNGSLMTNGDVSATFSGTITINGPVASGGHIAGPQEAAYNPTTGQFLSFTGPINATFPSTAKNATNPNDNAIQIRAGNVKFSGGGSYSRIEVRSGALQLGANNGVATNSYVDVGGNSNGNPVNYSIFDLNGFNQSIVGISDYVSSTNQVTEIENSSLTTAATLTLTPANPTSNPNQANLLFIASSNGNTATTVGQGTNAFITDSSASAPLNLTVNGDAAGTQYMITGSNAYRGVTTLTSGTLAVSVLANGGSNSSIGASTNAAGNLVFGGGTLRYTNTAISGSNSVINLSNSTTPSTDRNFTINNGSSGTIEVTNAGTVLTWSGGSFNTNGVLNKTGMGQLSLTGANQHTGGTNVNAGILLVDGSLSTGAVTVANLATLGGTGTIGGTVTPSSGGTIAPGDPLANSGVGTLTVAGLTLGNGSISNFEFGSGNDQITVNGAGALTVNGGNINLYNAGGLSAFSTNGTYTLMNITGGISGALSNLTVTNPTAGKFYNLANTSSLVQLTIGNASTAEWTNGAGNGTWTTGGPGGNWVDPNNSNAPVAFPNAVGVTAKFGTMAGGGTVNMNGNKTVSGLIFDNGSGYTISGSGTLTLNNGAAASAVSVNNGSHTIAVPISLAKASSIAFSNNSGLTISGAISGGQPILASGPGTLTLTANNSYSTTSISGSTVNIGTFGGSDTTGSLGSGDVTMSGGATLDFNRSNPYSFSGNINGSGGSAGSVNQLGSGSTTVGGAVNNVTTVNVAAGTLSTSSTINQSAGLNVTATGGLGNTGSGSLTANGSISGAGALNVDSSGTVNLNAANSYSGGTFINNGIVILGAAGALPTSSALTMNGGTLDLHGTNISLNNIAGTTTAGTITNNGSSASTSTMNLSLPALPGAMAGVPLYYEVQPAINDGSSGGKVAVTTSIANNISGDILAVRFHSPSNYSGGTTVNSQSIEAAANNAFGTGTITVVQNNASTNSSQIFLAPGVTIGNNIVVQQGNPRAVNVATPQGVIQIDGVGDDGTLTGTVTIDANNANDGLFNGPAVGSGYYLNVQGAVNTAGTANTITQIGGEVKYSGGGSYANMQINGLALLAANNGLSQSAVLQLSQAPASGTGPSNGTFDLNGFNQTAVALSASSATLTSTVQNSGGSASTLTLNTSGTNTFNGVINDGFAQTNLTVGGTGTQTLTNPGSSYTGVTTFSGSGVLEATNITTGGSPSSIGASSNAASNLVFDGGTLRYTGASSTITDRGFTINPGKTAHIGVAMAGVNLTFTSGSSNPTTTGSFEKTGAGTLTFDSTAPTYGYTGATTVSGGVLAVNNQLTNTSSISVAAGATLTGGGKIGSSGSTFNHTAGTINPGTIGGASAGTLTIGGSLNLNGGSVVYDVDGANLSTPSLQDLVMVNNGLTVSAPTAIALDFLNPGSPPSSAFDYVLFNYTGTSNVSNAPADFTYTTNLSVPTHFTTNISTPGEIIVHVVTTNPANLNWNSTSSSVWNTSTTNWYDTGAHVVTNFNNGDNVTFSDSTSSPVSTPQTAITLSGSVAPNVMTISSNTHNYTFSGTGKITGGGILNITGSSTTTIETNNDFSGGTNITNASATVDVGGSGTSGTLGTGDIQNNGTLKFTRTDGTALSPVTFVNNISGTGNLLNSSSGTTVMSGNISQTSVTLNGSGTTTLSGSAVTATGSLTVSGNTAANISAAVTTGTGLIVGNTSSVSASGGLNGSGGITMNSTASLMLGGPSSYDGNTVINAGTFYPSDPTAFGDSVGTTLVNAGGSIYSIQNNDYGNEAVTINGTGTSSSGALHAGGGVTSTFDGVVTLGSDSLIKLDVGSTLFLSGTGTGTALTGSHALSLAGTGTLSIGGNVTGVTSISAATAALSFSPQPSTTITIGAPISGTGSMAFNSSGSFAEGNLGTTVLNGSLSAFTGPMTVNSGNLSVQAGGVGLFTWTPTTGNVLTINGGGIPTSVVGTLFLAPTSGNLPNLSVPITMDARQSISLTVPSIENVSGNNTLSGAITLTTGGSEYNFQSDAGTLTIQSNLSTAALPSAREVNVMGAGNGIFSGGLTDSAAGAITLLKSGNGNWTIGATSSLHGGLVLSDNGALKIASGTSQTFTGVQTIMGGITTGTNDGLYVYSGSPHVDMGTGTGATLNVADSSAYPWIGTKLTIDNWTYGAGASGDHFIVGITSTVNPSGTGLTSAQLGQIQFTDFPQGASITTTATAARAVGEITPLIGDVNGDGHVNAADIVALEKALTNTSLYITERINGTGGMTASPSGQFTASDALFDMDINGDGKANNADLQYLLTYLKNGNGSTSSIPEPGSFVLLTLGGLLLAGRRLRRKGHRENCK